MSSEIRDRVKAELDTIILGAIELYMDDWDEAIADAKAKILAIEGLAVVDRGAGIEFLDLGTFYSAAQKELLMAGAKAQADKMLKEGWVMEVKDVRDKGWGRKGFA